MNLVYANTAVRMSDVSVKDEVINAQTTPARPTSVDYLKEIEDDEDITVDDDEADANVVADDTYYNIGGQRVAVAKLAEYIKNKSLEDLLKDFEVNALVCLYSCRIIHDKVFCNNNGGMFN